jgi:hypothetical protein
MERLEIIKNYIHGRFWWDLVVNFALFLSSENFSLKISILLRVYDLLSRLDRIDEDFLLMHRIPTIFQLVFIFFFVV